MPLINKEFISFIISHDKFLELEDIRFLYDDLLEKLKIILPDDRYLSIIKTKLEEACFFSVKSFCHINKKDY